MGDWSGRRVDRLRRGLIRSYTPAVATSSSIITRAAHAKINLALAVGPAGGPRGYHPICSWFVRIDLADQVRLERLSAGESRFECRWAPDAPRATPIEWPAEKDLSVRAHRLLEAHVGRTLPVSMTVVKRIPVGGGLGGGSSDAAAVLLGLRELFSLDVSGDSLCDLAQTLGSDVPFFVMAASGNAIVAGLGERVSSLPRASGTVVLIMPPFGCPTGDIYRAFDSIESGGREGDFLKRAQRVRELAEESARTARIPDGLFNDLAEPSLRTAPALRDVLERVCATTGSPVFITGSGSTLFVPCSAGVQESRALAGRLSADLRGCAVLAASLC